MASVAHGSVGRQLESLFNGGLVTGYSDRQLVEQFTSGCDVAGEAAFAALVSRHGPMVLNVCRQILGDLHHAEDAFQAVFLVLARRAQSIRDPDLLGNWLYGVAFVPHGVPSFNSTAGKKEEGCIMRPAGPGLAAAIDPIAQAAEQPVIKHEQTEALHSEISRLPRLFRLPVVLYYFEGLTLDEAATGFSARWERFATGWRGLAKNFVVVLRGKVLFCLALPSPLFWAPGQLRRLLRLPCATSQRRPRSSSRPDRLPPGPFRLRRRSWPKKC